jgi:hypothetical protein
MIISESRLKIVKKQLNFEGENENAKTLYTFITLVFEDAGDNKFFLNYPISYLKKR